MKSFDDYDIKPFLLNTARSIKDHFIEDNKGMYIVMSLLLIFAFYSGYKLSKPIRTELDKQRLVTTLDYFILNTHELRISQFRFHENMTLSDLRASYIRWKDYPMSDDVLITIYNEVCN